MRLDDYKCSRMRAHATRRGVAWVSLIEGPDTVFMFTDRGDGSMVETEVLAGTQHDLKALQDYCKKWLGYEGLETVVSCTEKDETLQQGFDLAKDAIYQMAPTAASALLNASIKAAPAS